MERVLMRRVILCFNVLRARFGVVSLPRRPKLADSTRVAGISLTSHYCLA
jgi:hypothetical protein